MELKLITFAKFAESIGVSRQAIYKNVKSGLLPSVDENGKQKIDLNDRQVQEYLRSIEDKNGQSLNIETPPKPSTSQTKKTKTDDNIESGQILDDPLKGIPDHLIKALDDGKLTIKQALSLPKVMLEKLKIYESTKQTKIKAQQLKGKLIDRELVKKVFGQIHEIDISQLIASKSKISSAMAALFECDDNNKITEAEEKIHDILYKVLKSQQIAIDNFLKKLK